MSRPIVMLSMVTTGDADGFDAWFDERDAAADPLLHEPAVAFNAIVMSLLDTTPVEDDFSPLDDADADVEMPMLAAA